MTSPGYLKIGVAVEAIAAGQEVEAQIASGRVQPVPPEPKVTNRRARRAMARAAKREATGAVLAAQALSRQELDDALRNYAGLMAAENFQTTRSVTLTNRADARVTIVAELRVFPAGDVGTEAPYVAFVHPRDVEAFTEGLRLEGKLDDVEVVASRAARRGAAGVFARHLLTPEQEAQLPGRTE